MIDATEYPLCWPEGVARNGHAVSAAGRTGFAAAQGRVLKSLALLQQVSGEPASDVVLSSNATARDDHPRDAGATVWFVWMGVPRCIPSDLYDRPADNFAAIDQIVRACIAELPRGGTVAVGAALAPFVPQPSATLRQGPEWCEILGVESTASPDDIRAAFRRQALLAHPDAGGQRADWDRLTRALEEARNADSAGAITGAAAAQVFGDWLVPQEADDQALWQAMWDSWGTSPEVGGDDSASATSPGDAALWTQ